MSDVDEEAVILVGFQPAGETVSHFRVVKSSQNIRVFFFKFADISIN